jgi:branched-subunit amino acid ABC-type transport system permease component
MLGSFLGLTFYHVAAIPFIAVLFVGMAGAGIAAVVLEIGIYRILRLRRVPLMNIVIATLGVSILLQNGSMMVWGSEPVAYPALFDRSGYDLGWATLSPQHLWIVALGVGLMVLLQGLLKFTRTGLALQATAQDLDAAQLMGINVAASTALTFAIAGAMAGAAGVLMGSLFFASFNMGFIPGIKAFVAATLGGLGSIGGAMLGGIIFGLIETFSARWISTAYKDAVGMALLILILLVLPQGLVGLRRRR